MSTEKDTNPPHNKPGIKSTEFWLNMLALTVAFLISAEVFADGSTALKIVALVAAILSNMGYAINRTSLKRDNLKSSVLATLSAAAEMAADALGNVVDDDEDNPVALKKKASPEVPPRIE